MPIGFQTNFISLTPERVTPVKKKRLSRPALLIVRILPDPHPGSLSQIGSLAAETGVKTAAGRVTGLGRNSKGGANSKWLRRALFPASPEGL